MMFFWQASSPHLRLSSSNVLFTVVDGAVYDRWDGVMHIFSCCTYMLLIAAVTLL
jgi:hypothetical protein